MNKLLIQAEKIKQQVHEENKLNNSSRRTYSADLKNTVLQFMSDNNLSCLKTRDLIGIGDMLLGKWKTRGPFSEKSSFNKIKVTKPKPPMIKLKHESGFYFEFEDLNTLDIILQKLKSL